MPNRAPRRVRFLIVLLLALALSAVYTSSAQSTALTQIIKSQDGRISVHVPQGWQERDTTSAVYPSVLAFGDSANSLQAAISSVTQTQTTVIPGMNGVIAIVSPTVVDGADPDTAITNLFNVLASGTQQVGGQILQQQQTTIGNGGYDAIIGIAATPNIQAKAIFGAFTDGANVGVFSLGASPEATFDTNQQMFSDMVNSIRVPAEAGSTIAPPSSNANNGVQASGSSGVTASKSGAFSVRLPQTYVSEAVTFQGFNDVIGFGDTQASEQALVSAFVNNQGSQTFTGIGGIIGQVDTSQSGGASLDSLVDPVTQTILKNTQSASVTIVQQPQAHTFGGQYPGELTKLNIGYIAVLHTDTRLIVAIVASDNLQANDAIMNAILESIRIPAEPSIGGQVVPTQVNPSNQTNGTLPTGISNDLFSMSVPAGWSITDNTSSQGYLSYGDSQAAADSRLHAVKPDLAPSAPITGSGGVVVLYPMSQFNIDPKNPDLTALMQRVLTSLQGYTVEQSAQPLDGSAGGLIAVISGSEHGYLALIPLGDQIAYVTATSTASGFDAMQATLLSVVKSVQPISKSSGLGGLGGLESTPEATPEITPTVESAGLGGLGSLGSATPAATAEASGLGGLAPATPNATPES